MRRWRCIGTDTMRGNLRIIILKDLEHEPRSGYALIKHIEKSLGRKPSPGSVYPLLEELRKGKKVTVKEKGRSKIYSLTALGRQELITAQGQIGQVIDSMITNVKMLSEWCDKDHSLVVQMLEALKEDHSIFHTMPKEVFNFRHAFIRAMLDGRVLRNRSKADKIFKEARLQLEALK